jgi:hypothetical protein
MIALSLASRLKAAGLVWQASTNDFFAIPDRGMDNRVFVLADLQAQLDLYRGWPVVTFHGTAEWALDYILTTEVVWLPREEQLRDTLLRLLDPQGNSSMTLDAGRGRYICTIPWQGSKEAFSNEEAAGAYGEALLFVLENQQPT